MLKETRNTAFHEVYRGHELGRRISTRPSFVSPLMMRFASIPDYLRPFTRLDIHRMVADEGMWFRRGSWLYEAGEEQFAAMLNMPDSSKLYVGKPIASDVSGAEYRAHEREIMGAMLFAMACECWLKGLIVMATPRASSAARKRLDAWISTEVAGRGGYGKPVRDRMSIVFEVCDTREHNLRAARFERLREQEDKDRYNMIRAIKDGHDLVTLAREARLNSRLAKQDVAFLGLLTKANTLGRYPAPWDERGLAPWGGIFADGRRRERICAVVKDRHETLE